MKENVFNPDVLEKSYYEIRKNVRFKHSVQDYGLNLYDNIFETCNSYENGTYEFKPLSPFIISERGHRRYIQATNFCDRVPTHALCENILNPTLKRYIIYDNCASIKGRGIDMQRNRLYCHLQKFYRRHGNKGYVLLGDFSKFFDNLEHEKILAFLEDKFSEDVVEFADKWLMQYAKDVSYMTDEKYSWCMDEVFNSMEYELSIPNEKRTGEKIMRKSVGIGGEPSQPLGVSYPTRLDNYIKIVMACKYYGRYMDDFYVIHEDREFLQGLLEEIKPMCEEMGLHLNMRKTHIARIDKPFTFLKVKWFVTDTGKVVRKHTADAFTRERQKLRKFRVKLESGEMEYKDIENQFKSVVENLKKYDNFKSLRSMQKYYNNLYIKPFKEGHYGAA